MEFLIRGGSRTVATGRVTRILLLEQAGFWGEGIRKSAGAAAGVPGFDEAFEQVQRDRKAARFRTAS
jgi:hypothetical protein